MRRSYLHLIIFISVLLTATKSGNDDEKKVEDLIIDEGFIPTLLQKPTKNNSQKKTEIQNLTKHPSVNTIIQSNEDSLNKHHQLDVEKLIKIVPIPFFGSVRQKRNQDAVNDQNKGINDEHSESREPIPLDGLMGREKSPVIETLEPSDYHGPSVTSNGAKILNDLPAYDDRYSVPFGDIKIIGEDADEEGGLDDEDDEDEYVTVENSKSDNETFPEDVFDEKDFGKEADLVTPVTAEKEGDVKLDTYIETANGDEKMSKEMEADIEPDKALKKNATENGEKEEDGEKVKEIEDEEAGEKPEEGIEGGKEKEDEEPEEVKEKEDEVEKVGKDEDEEKEVLTPTSKSKVEFKVSPEDEKESPEEDAEQKVQVEPEKRKDAEDILHDETTEKPTEATAELPTISHPPASVMVEVSEKPHEDQLKPHEDIKEDTEEVPKVEDNKIEEAEEEKKEVGKPSDALSPWDDLIEYGGDTNTITDNDDLEVLFNIFGNSFAC